MKTLTLCRALVERARRNDERQREWFQGTLAALHALGGVVTTRADSDGFVKTYVLRADRGTFGMSVARLGEEVSRSYPGIVAPVHPIVGEGILEEEQELLRLAKRRMRLQRRLAERLAWPNRDVASLEAAALAIVQAVEKVAA